MSNRSPAFLIAVAVALVLPLRLVSQTTALTHANVVDLETGSIRRDQTIIIERNTIRTIGGPSTPIPRGARIRGQVRPWRDSIEAGSMRHLGPVLADIVAAG